jgi:hypothetical protein
VELRETTRNMIAQVERETGFPVVVTRDATLTNPSTIKMAAKGNPGHLILVSPNAPAGVDYYAIYYCRMIQRFFENPPTERFIFTVGQRGRSQVGQLLERTPIAKKVPASRLPILVEQLLSGFMIHLRSIPIAMRVDDWIFDNHPDLAVMQKNAIQPQLKENMGTFGEAFRSMVPPKILGSTMSINAAFAQFWADKWRQFELALPFKSGGFAANGEKLLKIWNEIPDSGTTDRALIDAWGAELNVTGWYDWMPYEPSQS